MNFHEYQAKELFAQYGITVPPGKVANSPDAAVDAAKALGGSQWMVKAQIHAGGRGKAGGVKFCKSFDEVHAAAKGMLGQLCALIGAEAERVAAQEKLKKETDAMLEGLKEDKVSAEKEYAAIMEYWEKLQPMCIAKPEPYAERKRRREAEIAGLKEALTILEEEAGSPSAFLQVRTARRA